LLGTELDVRSMVEDGAEALFGWLLPKAGPVGTVLPDALELALGVPGLVDCGVDGGGVAPVGNGGLTLELEFAAGNGEAPPFRVNCHWQVAVPVTVGDCIGRPETVTVPEPFTALSSAPASIVGKRHSLAAAIMFVLVVPDCFTPVTPDGAKTGE